MLQIKDICKQYKTGELIQQALNHVSLNLRDNEFVAILGTSGSGKTTLLNIIGGLDSYDSGNLIINGVSTKKYRDRQWDSYRNHTIGFVFQAYNLIPHQTVLANVEIALTISGISRTERRERAVEALRKVGLESQMHKKPNQMSGGQMQRVAIARALVNDPAILLADEPTGALDSETSIQVMDLLKEVAKDRLVVMVTHNPELAEQYANRIVNLKDGVILSDTNPYEPNVDAAAVVQKSMGRSSMSPLTALSLSFNNLLTKKARTILVAFAGSIGIIGIALIMALSNGVNQYIKDTEEKTLSQYPIEIQKQGFDLESMLVGSGAVDPESPDADSSSDAEEADVSVRERETVSRMFSQISSNDLGSFAAYLKENPLNLDKYTNAVEYRYNVVPQIYQEHGDQVTRVNPARFSGGFGYSAAMMPSSFSNNSFHEMPKNERLYVDSYDVKAGHWPENPHEIVLVLSQDGMMSDVISYTLGLREYQTLEDMFKQFSQGEKVDVQTGTEAAYSYEEILGKSFKVVPASDYYRYDENIKVWSDLSEDKDFIRELVSQAESLTVVGIVQPKEDEETTVLATGLNYPAGLTGELMDAAKNSAVVQAQLSDRGGNIFTGKPFGEEEKESFDMASLFTVDESKIKEAFQINPSAMQINPSALDLSGLEGALTIPELGAGDIQDVLKDLRVDTSHLDLSKLMQNVVADYLQKNPEAQSAVGGLQSYLSSSEAQAAVQTYLGSQYVSSGIAAEIQSGMTDLYKTLMQEYVTSLGGAIPSDQTAFLQGFADYVAANGQERAGSLMEESMQKLQLTDDQVQGLLASVAAGYQGYLTNHNLADISSVQQSLQNYLNSPDGQTKLLSELTSQVDVADIQAQLSAAIAAKAGEIGNSIASELQKSMGQMIQGMMGQLGAQLAGAFLFDPSVFQSAIRMNTDAGQLKNMFATMMNQKSSSYEENLSMLGYADELQPAEIVIFPKDFNAKNTIKDIITSYNDGKKEAGMEDKVIVYTDFVGTLMSSVTKIVDVVSYVLIAFVAISLIVSSIMIGVITFISVLERNKEIGILRAIGASKRNISQVFNAETFITGLLAGGLGVGIALLLQIPINRLIHQIAERNDINAVLPVKGAIILIVLSVFLTILSGLLPARRAAKSDPVAALRSE